MKCLHLVKQPLLTYNKFAEKYYLQQQGGKNVK